MKLLSLLMIGSVFSAQAMLTPATKEYVKLHKSGVYRDAEGFVYRQRGTETRINTYDVDKELRTVTPSQFKALSSHVLVHKMTNGEYSVRLNAKGLGGGVWLGKAMYWGTKALCWGAVSATVTVCAKAALPGLAAELATTVAAEKAATGASVVASQILEKVGEKAIVEGATFVASQAGEKAVLSVTALGGLTAAIEAASVGAGAAGLSVWWLP